MDMTFPRRILRRAAFFSRLGIAMVCTAFAAVPIGFLTEYTGLPVGLGLLVVALVVFFVIVRGFERVRLEPPSGSDEPTDAAGRRAVMEMQAEAFARFMRLGRTISLQIVGFLMTGIALYQTSILLVAPPEDPIIFAARIWIRGIMLVAGIGGLLLWRSHLIGRQAADRYVDALSAELTDHPESADVLMARGHLHLIFHRHDQALADFAEAARLAPRTPDILLMHAVALTLVGREESAIERLTTVIELDPENIEAHVERGQLYLDLGEIEKSKADYAVVARLSSKERE